MDAAKGDTNKMTSYDLGIARLESIFATNNKVLGRLRLELLSCIRKERENEQIDQSLMINFLRMLDITSNNITTNNNKEINNHIEFEKYFIRETLEFYQFESEIYIPKKYTREFELIGPYLETLIENRESGPYNMFIHSNIDSLQPMYKLFLRIDDQNIKLNEIMCKYIRESGEKIINKNEIKLIDSLKINENKNNTNNFSKTIKIVHDRKRSKIISKSNVNIIKNRTKFELYNIINLLLWNINIIQSYQLV